MADLATGFKAVFAATLTAALVSDLASNFAVGFVIERGAFTEVRAFTLSRERAERVVGPDADASERSERLASVAAGRDFAAPVRAFATALVRVFAGAPARAFVTVGTALSPALAAERRVAVVVTFAVVVRVVRLRRAATVSVGRAAAEAGVRRLATTPAALGFTVVDLVLGAVVVLRGFAGEEALRGFAATTLFVAFVEVRGFEATSELLLATRRFETWDRTAIEWPP